MTMQEAPKGQLIDMFPLPKHEIEQAIGAMAAAQAELTEEQRAAVERHMIVESGPFPD